MGCGMNMDVDDHDDHERPVGLRRLTYCWVKKIKDPYARPKELLSTFRVDSSSFFPSTTTTTTSVRVSVCQTTTNS